MTARRIWGLLCLLAACLAGAHVAASPIDARRGDVLMKRQRIILAAAEDVSSPDVPLDGACAADILQHCKHLLSKDASSAAKAKASTGKAVAAASKTATISRPDGGEIASSSVAATSSKEQQSAATTKVTAAAATQGTGTSTVSEGAAGAADKPQAAVASAAGTAPMAAAAEGGVDAAASTAAGAGTGTAGAATSATTGAAGGAAVAATGASAAASGKATAAGSGGVSGGAADASGAAGGASGAAADTAASGSTAAQATQQQTQAAAGGSGAAGTASSSLASHTTTQAAAATQQQQHTQRRRRRLLVGEVDVQAVAAQVGSAATAVNAELHAAEAHKDDLALALQLLGLSSSLPSAAMSMASAPIARCLRGVMHASEMSISPNMANVVDECKAEVRSVLIKRSGDVRYDPPLLAACSHDIATHCGEVGGDTTAVLGCLKPVKQQLLPQCRGAVTVRQAAAAEDLSLDPDLQRSCGVEREKLCLEAGWGSGAAQACLLGHLRGSLPQVFSEVIFPAADAASESAAASARGKAVELSANCSAALVQRLIEEGEDIRFNYRLSAACAGDKQVLCRDVRPGGAAVLRCLEDHLGSPDMQEDCRGALNEFRQLRSLDVRLDHTFAVSCANDARSLCDESVVEQLHGGPAEVAFGLSAPFECLRSRLDMVRDATCRRHMYESTVAAFTDNRLDAGLMRGCHQEIVVLCSAHPARALECLQDKIDKYSRDDSPEVLKGKISDKCMTVVLGRKVQAATDVAFVPDLMAACAREHATLCAAPGMEGVRALDCLADHRNSPDFSDRCGDALRDYLAEAARDIRTMAGLQKDCGEEIQALCKSVQPGEGRVISCLRDQRANITGELCRRQVMRLLGFLVEDHRMDVKLTAACTSDVQKYCGGVEAGDGQVHDCLRRSADHLSPECRAAEEAVERLEHEDVRLNPKLMRECPLAISSFCGDVPPGDARVISCLQTNMDKGHFPPACKVALTQLTDRASIKYSLNFRLRLECDDDTQRLCPDAVDELGASKQAFTGTGSAHTQETTLACLAGQPTQLEPGCRSELQALVKLSLNRYRVGMPLTSQCDGDVMQRCQVDQMAAPFLQSGYVLGCLAKHAAKLHKPCWELVSTMDEGQFKRAAAAETTAWRSESGSMDEKMLQQVTADVRRELEPRIYSNVHEQINRRAIVMARNVTGALVRSIAPKVNALMHTTLSLLMLTAVGLLGALLAWRKFVARGGGMLVVRKDGRV